MPYRFDANKAARVIEFIQTQLIHVEGKLGGKPFLLEQWQKELVQNVFGWQDENGLRKYNRLYLSVSVRNGKTTLAAAIIAWFLFCEKEYGQQLYSAASTKEQAALIFRILKGMILANPTLRKRCKITTTTKYIENKTNGATYKSLCAKPDNLQGLNANLILVDELQTIKDRDLVDTLVQRTGSRTQPLVCFVGTSGFDRRSIGYELYSHALKCKENPSYDPKFYPCVFSAPMESDPHEEKTWRLSNPNIGSAVQLEFLKGESERAKRSPNYLNTFRQRHCNQWTEAENRFLSIESWRQGKGELPDLRGYPAVLTFDLSTTRDLTAVVVAVKHEGAIYFFDRSFIPAERATERQKKDRVPYKSWGSWVTLTEGNVVDYEVVKGYILEQCQTFSVYQIGYDPWNATSIAIDLEKEGYPLTPIRQGFATMSDPTKKFESFVLSNKVRHNSPVLDWQASNLCCKSDDNGNVRPVKPAYDESGRIDTLLCCIMACKLLNLDPESTPYDNRSVISL